MDTASSLQASPDSHASNLSAQTVVSLRVQDDDENVRELGHVVLGADVLGGPVQLHDEKMSASSGM